MRQNTQPEKQSLTPMQKQAVLVCIVCALAALLTIGITLVLIHRGKEPAASSEQPGTEQPADDANIADHYQINEQSSALLPETADAGDAYQSETLFIGDSNTVRLYANGLISLQQFCAKEGIGTSAALNEGIVTFKKDSSRYTIAEAVAKMKPRRVVIMLGTNDTGMAVEDFISNYKQLVQAIQTSYPYTDIIVNTVPPVPADHSNYPNMDQTRIDDFNMALLSMCEEMGLKFLNTAEALKDSTGYGNADYYQSGDIHLKTSGLKVLLNYLRTHAYETEDRRPDTNNIPSRAEYVPDPSSAVASSSSEVTSSSSEVQEDTTQYQASYRVDKTGGGTLSAGNDNGKTTLTYSVGASQSVSVTAVPASGHVFVKWSDGVTNKTRTDANFKQNLDVTAVFAAASVQISSSGKAAVGGSCTFHAKIGGKYLEADSIRWYANGVEAASAAGQTSVTVPITAEMQGLRSGELQRQHRHQQHAGDHGARCPGSFFGLFQQFFRQLRLFFVRQYCFVWFFQHFFRGFLRKYIRLFFLFFVGKGIRQQLQRGREHQLLPQRQLVSQRFLVGSRKRQHLAQQQCGRQFLPQQFREQLSQQCFL